MDNTCELTHWGIKGMRWGVRRYQNKDGSLTPAGRKRYGDDADGKPTKSGGSTSKASSGKKSVSDMSDDELARAINRKRLEDQYNSMYPEQVTKGKKFMDSLLNKVIAPAATESGRRFLTNYLNKMGDDILKDKAKPDELAKLKREHDTLDYKKKIEKLKKDDDLSWDDKIKQQTYEQNKKKFEYEDWDRKVKDAKKEYENIKNKTKTSDDQESSTTEEKKVYSGTVEDGPSKKTSYAEQGKSKVDDIIDAEWRDVTPSETRNDDTLAIGKTVIAGLLEDLSDR